MGQVPPGPTYANTPALDHKESHSKSNHLAQINHKGQPFIYNLVFRIMINGMYFPLCACIFPVTNTLFLPGEVFTFWLEHILLLVIPLFLLYENQLKTEPLSDFSYAFSQYGYYYIYNLLICQPITLLTRALLLLCFYDFHAIF